MRIRVRFNQERARFSSAECERAGFGPNNSGIVVDFPGTTPREAFEAWQETVRPGDRLSPFYLIIEEVK